MLFFFLSLLFFVRLHAHRGHGGSPEASGRAPRGPAGLWEQPASGGSTTGWQTAHDPAPAEADSHKGCAALLQHQSAGQGAHAQTLPGDAGSQGLIGGWLIGCGNRKWLEPRLRVLRREGDTPAESARQDGDWPLSLLLFLEPRDTKRKKKGKKEQMQNLVISINIKWCRLI